MNENNCEQKAQLYKKLNAFRADVIQCDWKDDKMVSLGGNKGYPYLSSDKIIKNLAPLLVKHGIELDVEYSELASHEKDGVFHWTIKATVYFTDVDTGYSTSSCAYGEGQDSQDKGVAKAQTAAFKKCLSARNMIADGIDPDAVDIWEPKSYYKKTAEEQEEVKSKVLANAVKPAPKEKPPFKNLEETAKVFPPKEEPKKEEPKKEEKAPEPKEEPKEPKYELTAVQKKVIGRITKDYEELAKNGGIDIVEYNEMLSAYMDLDSPQAVKAFIDKFRRPSI